MMVIDDDHGDVYGNDVDANETMTMMRMMTMIKKIVMISPHKLLRPVESLRIGEVHKSVAKQCQAVRVGKGTELTPPLIYLFDLISFQI